MPTVSPRLFPFRLALVPRNLKNLSGQKHCARSGKTKSRLNSDSMICGEPSTQAMKISRDTWPSQRPRDTAGPQLSFKGNIFAEILANVFRYNLQDIADKIDQNGMYHTSTKGAIEWGGYRGIRNYPQERWRLL